MSALCPRHSHLDASYGSCATLHGDWRSPEEAANQRARDDARRMAAALTAYADGMHASSRLEAQARVNPEDPYYARAARRARADARAALHAYPALRALVD